MSLSLDLLKKHWGHDSFRDLQQEAIDSILSGKDTLVIMPTGSGKSLCYQLPALMAKGVCLVISPLIALMKDQVQQLNKKNIPAAALYSGLSHEESKEIYRNALDEEIKLLYVSPERLQSERFLRFLTNARISFIAVDEAHCISQWGHDFRPAYLNIKDLKYELPGKPILALTATATPQVEKEIINCLELKEASVFYSSFLRKELSLIVKKVENKETQLVSLLKNKTRSSIVYCRSRRACKELSLLLNQEGIHSNFYHAGLSKEERTQAQNDWLENKVQTVVSTNAFGMGIDKADVGLVIHYDLPENLEAYYQEVGRAGRDGVNSQGILLYNSKSLQKQLDLAALKFPKEEALRQLYTDVCNYLQIPMNFGSEEYFDFELLPFVKQMNYNILTALHGMQLLAKQKLWQLSDNLHMPMRVQILASREELNYIAQNYHREDAVLKQLLRMYNGIWQHPVPINEYDLAAKIKTSVDQIKKHLNFLANRSYIKLQAKKDKPQLFFTDQRYPAEQIVIKYDEILWHKKRDTERLTALQQFVINTTDCRMQQLATYFGQVINKPCGTCDICDTSVARVYYKDLKVQIESALELNPSIALNELLGSCSTEERKIAIREIRGMVSEGLFKINSLGELSQS